jgi:CheY-like chemotaxis protein
MDPRLSDSERPSYDLRPAATLRLLVVEPDADTRALYRQSFQMFGCDIVEAVDGREALAHALVRVPSAILTEVRLPFIDGYALCEILRRDRVTARVPILVVTGEARRDAIDRLKHAGANAVLVKPATPEQVLAEVRRLLDSAADSPQGVALMTSPHSASTRRPMVRMSKSFARLTTTTPPMSPPRLVCPSCDQSLTYELSYVGGVSREQAEQWDQYVCPSGCGIVEYRHRTRKIRRVS